MSNAHSQLLTQLQQQLSDHPGNQYRIDYQKVVAGVGLKAGCERISNAHSQLLTQLQQQLSDH
ncbi:hypothetical protein PSY51_24115, partial [Shigella flexneri]|nr:hypothetical protein [Shigella flexneri]